MRSYMARLISLLPQGWAWRAQRRSKERVTLQAIATELERVDNRAMELMREIDPRQTAELLTDWERELCLPDPCTPAGQTQAERRAARWQ